VRWRLSGWTTFSSLSTTSRLPKCRLLGKHALQEYSRNDRRSGMLRFVRQHLVSHWRVWLAVVIAVVAVNELVDRNFFDHREHVDGDFVLAVIALCIGFLGSYLVARRRPGGA
jgi:hypothetical protein